MNSAYRRVFLLVALALPFAWWACGGGGESGGGAPSADEASSASAEETAAVAELLSGTYTLKRTVDSNSCNDPQATPGTTSEETVTISQADDGALTMTVEETSQEFKGKADGNDFTLVNESTQDAGGCPIATKTVFTGTRQDDGSLSGTIATTQKVTDCNGFSDCERKETFTAPKQ